MSLFNIAADEDKDLLYKKLEEIFEELVECYELSDEILNQGSYWSRAFIEEVIYMQDSIHVFKREVQKFLKKG